MLVAYAPLEPGITSSLGLDTISFSGASPTLSTVTTLITIIILMLIGGAAFYRYVMSGIYRLEASENGVRKSNEAFKGATFGILGVFLMFLIFFTFNRDILLSDVGLSALKSGGVVRSGGGALTIKESPSPVVSPQTPAPSSGDLQEKILNAALAFKGSPTNVPGTNNGRLACAYAVNEVIKRAGLSSLGSLSVSSVESALNSGRGQQISVSSAVPGDIVILTSSSGNHTGVCIKEDCERVLSNSSSKASFIWVSDPGFTPYYRSPFKIYRVLN